MKLTPKGVVFSFLSTAQGFFLLALHRAAHCDSLPVVLKQTVKQICVLKWVSQHA